MPLVEYYPNWVSLDPVTNTQSLTDAFYKNTSVWQQRPTLSHFANCGWYKFPYCSHVPWYQDLNTESVIGKERAEIYNEAKTIFNHILNQFGNDYVMWGAELNSVPPGNAVNPHFDRHFYSDYTTRIHIVLTTNPDVLFIFENQTKKFAVGECFIFNNKLQHSITNVGDTARLHLVVDIVPKTVFQYVERSISPFGGHEGTKHILSYLAPSNELYSNYIRNVAGHKEIYPFLTVDNV